jgi:DNA replication and repair protein RecF
MQAERSRAQLGALQISHIRNLDRVRLEQLRRVNVFFGRNGSGKTSVLESIHLLGLARSFRGSSVKSLISHGQATCTVFGRLTCTDGPGPVSLGVSRSTAGEAQIKVAGRVVRTVAELAEEFPVLVINADSFDLLTGSPVARRQFLDWGVFHVEHQFFAQWQRYQRCIKQRNKLLRHGKIDARELAVWTRDLAAAGAAISEFRRAYFNLLVPRFQAIIAQLAPALEGLELRFRQGWDQRVSYEEALESSAEADKEQGYTHVGPQRADIRVIISGHSAADTLSRGQQKLVVCSLKLAQGQLMYEMGHRQCAYLVDDLPSELDRQHSEHVCALLADMDAQVFITCVHRDDILAVWPDAGLGDMAMFHVEHGRVTPYPEQSE